MTARRPEPPSPTTRPSVNHASPDRGKLRAGFRGVFRTLWFIVALTLYAVGFLLHFLGIMLIRFSGLGGGSQQLTQLSRPTTLSRSSHPKPPPSSPPHTTAADSPEKRE